MGGRGGNQRGDLSALAKVGKPVWGPELPALLKLRPCHLSGTWGLKASMLEGQEGETGPEKKKGGRIIKGPVFTFGLGAPSGGHCKGSC